jgi:hypothetical protein
MRPQEWRGARLGPAGGTPADGRETASALTAEALALAVKELVPLPEDVDVRLPDALVLPLALTLPLAERLPLAETLPVRDCADAERCAGSGGR